MKTITPLVLLLLAGVSSRAQISSPRISDSAWMATAKVFTMTSASAALAPAAPDRPAPSLRILGYSALCSNTADYQVSGLPAGASVSWEVSNAGIAGFASSGSGHCITLNSLGAGAITLTAMVTDSFQTYRVPLTIALGIPPVRGFLLEGENLSSLTPGLSNSYTVCAYETVTLTPGIPEQTEVVESQWEVLSGTYCFVGPMNGGTLTLTTAPTWDEPLVVRYRYQTPCGWSAWEKLVIATVDCETLEEPF